MCGITGLFSTFDALADGGASEPYGSVGAKDILRRMIGSLTHRGPDNQGASVISSEGSAMQEYVLGMGHTRLAILDLTASGDQPMLDDHGHEITFNGEVYNFKELRCKLGLNDNCWKSQTDTEVVLRAYSEWGTDCLKHLRGMFAFAIKDTARKRLILARDMLGIKPLYYYHRDGLFIFASEVRALLASGLVPRCLSPAGLISYLQSGSVGSPYTIIDGVRLLSPGHYMIVEPGGDGRLEAKEIPYTEDWLTAAPLALGRKEAIEALHEKLKESVRLHLISDVPLGLFLSGGMDSSAIVALASQVDGERPKTFSVVFAEERYSEATYARQIAKKFDTEHHEIHLGGKQLLDMLPLAIGAEDQPTMDGINTYVVSKAVKGAGITVALSGLGGDELFAGYPTFRRALHLKSVARLPIFMRQGISSFGRQLWDRSVQQKKLWQMLASDGSPAVACAVSRQLFSVDEVEALISDHSDLLAASRINLTVFDGALPDNDPVNAVSLCELRGYMANTLLRDTDCMSMAHSLEVRVPFLDADVVRFVLRLPGSWKMNGGRQKPLLQDALGELLPAEVMNRPKMGFTLPFEEWMQSRLRNEIETTFADKKQFALIGLHPERVREIWQQFLRTPQKIGWSRPWALYVLGRWCAQHQVAL